MVLGRVVVGLVVVGLVVVVFGLVVVVDGRVVVVDGFAVVDERGMVVLVVGRVLVVVAERVEEVVVPEGGTEVTGPGAVVELATVEPVAVAATRPSGSTAPAALPVKPRSAAPTHANKTGRTSKRAVHCCLLFSRPTLARPWPDPRRFLKRAPPR